MKPFEWIPPWSVVKKIGGSKTVALAGLFPFVGYLVVANSQFVEWFSLVFDRDPGSSAETSNAVLRIQEIYFALVWLSSGVILYRVLCPKEISQFKDLYEFSRNELEVAEPIRLRAYQSTLPSSKWLSLFQPPNLRHAISETNKVVLNEVVAQNGFFPDIGDDKKTKPVWLAGAGREIALCLNTHYDTQNYSRPILRAVTMIAFGLGYVKLSLPAYKVLVHLLAMP